MSEVSKERVSEFYDSFLEEEESGLKLNVRHYKVFRELCRAGLKRDHKVLEVGCGFGTVTSLIAPYVKRGKVLAVDISPNRVAVAQKNLRKYRNIEFLVADMSNFQRDEKFDVVLMPDVLEHIPIEQHEALFQTYARHLNPGGMVFVHIPHPLSLDWARINRPESLQIIDQSLYTEMYMPKIAVSGFYIDTLISYNLTLNLPDYQIIVFKQKEPYPAMSTLPTNAIRWRKLRYRLSAWFARL
ncbi:MAG: class I SAM-dependent methyltransferase [Bacteroidota bacterium]